MSTLFMRVFWILPFVILGGATSNDQDPVFLIPFEISFGGTNQFGFTIHNLDHFIDSSSAFFNVQPNNITIAFIKEISSTDYIDVGFTVSADTLEEETRIRNVEIQSYRSYLMTDNNLPQIIGMEAKYAPCSNGKYSTFYHYTCECQWLCDHLFIYRNQTHECQSVSNISSIIQIREATPTRFLYIGYGSSALITACCCMIYLIIVNHKEDMKETKDETKSKPSIARRDSFYFYDDEDSNGEDKGKRNERSDDQSNTEIKEVKPVNVALSIKSTRSNSVDCTNIPSDACITGVDHDKKEKQSNEMEMSQMEQPQELIPIEGQIVMKENAEKEGGDPNQT
eukprot:393825_1